jgi:AcrR family transcriptional regulator
MNSQSDDGMGVHPGLSLHERLVAVRRDHILDAATRVFAARGFQRATIREIARLAGVADGTIYNYFANKSALVLGILDRLNETEQRRQHLGAALKNGLEPFLRDYLRHRLAVFERVGFDAFHVLISELLVNTELRERYRRQVLEPTFVAAEAAAQGWLAGDLDRPLAPPLATRVIAGLVLGVLVLRLLDDPVLAARWDELPDALADLLVHGILTVQRATEDPDGTDQRT